MSLLSNLISFISPYRIEVLISSKKLLNGRVRLTMKEKHRLSPAYGMLAVLKVVRHNYGERMKGDWMEFRRLRD